MQPRIFPTIRSDFARLIARKFAPARLLFVGYEAAQFSEQGSKDGLDSTGCSGIAELDALRPDGNAPRFDLAIWFYPPEIESANDDSLLDRLTKLTDNLVLIPGAGANVAKRRPRLVAALVGYGFFPNYDCDVVEIEPGAVRLSRQKTASVEALLPKVETGFARINAQMRGLHRTLRTRMAELEAADRHIARLEEKVLKLKQAKRDLKQLKAEKQALRKSPERKIGQVILAPYRLPQKLIREMRKRFGRPVASKNPALTPNEYQKWLQRCRPSAARLAAARQASHTFSYRPLVSIITPVFNTAGGVAGRSDRFCHQSGLRKLGADSDRRRLHPGGNARAAGRRRASRPANSCSCDGKAPAAFRLPPIPDWNMPAANGSASSITTISWSRTRSSRS